MTSAYVTSVKRDESQTGGGAESTIHIRFRVPHTEQQTIMVFSTDDTVWTAKQRLLDTVGKGLKDGLNYGLFCPPNNGRAGKFLDEERPIRDYPLPGPIGYLEFLPKKRVHKNPEPNITRLKKVNSSSSQKKFLEYIQKGDGDRVTMALNAGLDPNFTSTDKTGETPLTLAATLQRPRMIMLALVGGGAFIDYRNKKGLTAMHVAAQTGNRDALRALLDLGGSPNYKDSAGLTALYHCVLNDTNPLCVEMLLHERAELDVADERGWTELHQACKLGRVQHLQHLIFYGADMNSRTEGGDTPLHVCARYKEEECARNLMFRGADKTIKNIHNQDPSEVALQCGHSALATAIQEFKKEEIGSLLLLFVVLFTDLPQYNDKRRGTLSSATIRNLQRSRSNPNLSDLFQQDTSYTASLSSAQGYQYLSNGFLHSPASGHGKENGSTKSSTSPKWKHNTRMVSVRKDSNGYGFVIRGARSRPGSETTTLNFRPSPEIPALQYFDQIQKGSVADTAGLLAGDFILEINGESVTNASHEHTVQLIRQCVATLRLKVVTVISVIETTSQSESVSIGSVSPSPKKQAPLPPLVQQQKSQTGSVSSKAALSLNSWEALVSLDETLAKYDVDSSSNSDTTSLRYTNGAGLTVSKDTTDVEGPVYNSTSGTATYITKAELHRPPKDNEENVNNERGKALSSGECSDNVIEPPAEFDTRDDTQPEPVIDYNEDEDEGMKTNTSVLLVSSGERNRNTLLPEVHDNNNKYPAPIESTTEPVSSVTRPVVSSLAPPPPPPPPPPPAPASQFSSIRSTTSTASRPQLQILEEARRQEDYHAQVLAAVLKRRDRLENQGTENIDDQLIKSNSSSTLVRSGESVSNNTLTVNGAHNGKPNVTNSIVYKSAGVNSEANNSTTFTAGGVKSVNGTANGGQNGGHNTTRDSRTVVSASNGGKVAGHVAGKPSEDLGYLAAAEKARQEYLMKQSTMRNAVSTLPKNSTTVGSAEFAQMVALKAQQRQNNTKNVDQNGVNETRNGVTRFEDTSQSTDGNSRVYSGKVQPKIMSPQGKENGKTAESAIKSNNVTPAVKTVPVRPGNTAIKTNGALNANVTIESLPNKNLTPINGLAKPVNSVNISQNKVNNSTVIKTDFKDLNTINSSEYGPAPVTSTLRSVAAKSNSMMFKAKDPLGGPLATSGQGAGGKRGVENWTVDDVVEWLESFDYGSYRETFSEHNIDGAKLVKYGQNDFAELGVSSLLHQVKLEREVKKAIKNGGVIVT